jgi:zinc resistance-associated protein
MRKTIAAGAAFILAASAAAYAQQPPAGPDSGRADSGRFEAGRHHFVPEDGAALLDARVAAMHAGLRLTADQEKTWPAFEQAWRDLAEIRGKRPPGPRAGESLDPVQRTQRAAEVLTTRGAALKRYADALAPLYQSLDDGQKRRFGVLSRMGTERYFHRFAYRHGSDRERGEFASPRGEFPGPRGEFPGLGDFNSLR